MPIDSKENKMVRDRKLVGNLGKKLVEVRNLVEQNGMEDLDDIDKLQLTTTHNDLQTVISINDGTFISTLLLSETAYNKINNEDSAMI